MDLDTICFLKDGKYRILVLRELSISPLLPSEIAKKFELNRSSISRILKGLKEKGLIESNSSKTRTIAYFISKKGKEILEELNDK